ncbi:MAG TPA: FAD-binding protein [Syntrophomonadaceae bacterium]|nr:FAD-binding protein [Syntrophomonadaceae bacterium]
MSLLEKVLIVAENSDVVGELCTAGRACGDKVELVLIDNEAGVQEAIALGADKIYCLNTSDQDRMVEDFLPTIANLLKQEKPNAIILSASTRGKLLAARLAAKLATTVLNDSLSLEVVEGNLISKKRIYGGAALRDEKATGEVSVVTVSAGTFNALDSDNQRKGESVSVDFIEPSYRAKRLEVKTKVGEQVNLTVAKQVVCIGRGLAAQEDISMINELAALMEAEVGCTRPIAEGEQWMTKDRYVGVSGVMLKPDLYLGAGISGQIQHMVGVDQAKVIVAINKDSRAQIFQYADYGIVDDIYTVVPALIKKFKE